MEIILNLNKTYFIYLRNSEGLTLEEATAVATQKFSLIQEIDQQRADHFGLDVHSNDVEILSFSKLNNLKQEKLNQLYDLTTSTKIIAKIKYLNLEVEDTLAVVAEVFLRKKNNGLTFRYDIAGHGFSIINIPISVATFGCTKIEEYRTNLRQFKKQYENVIDSCKTLESLQAIDFSPINILGVSFDARDPFIIEITPQGDMMLVDSKTGIKI